MLIWNLQHPRPRLLFTDYPINAVSADAQFASSGGFGTIIRFKCCLNVF